MEQLLRWICRRIFLVLNFFDIFFWDSNAVFLYVPFEYLYNNGVMNDLTYQIFLTYNKLIILFNIMPVVPLDGSKVLGSILEMIIPYKLNLKLINIVSVFVIVVF